MRRLGRSALAAGAGMLMMTTGASADGSHAPKPAERCGTGSPRPVVCPADAPPVADDWCGPGTGGLQVVVDGEVRDLEFPLKHTDVDADIAGSVARVTVTQTFQNPFAEIIEAVYVFPLPHEAAVDDMEMILGERVVRGVIERRAEAQRRYREARDAGKVASLLEQERPNLFTQSVANILPGNEIKIRITYVENLEYDAGHYEFAFPMVVGPRYIPPGGPPTVQAGFFPDRRPAPGVPDAHRLNPDFLPPGFRSGHDISLEVRLDAGTSVRDLESVSHRIERKVGRRAATVRLHPLDTVPNKDFVLRWRVAGDRPEAGVLAHHDGEHGYVSVFVHPEIAPGDHRITPKEMVFVMDCSGSMNGEPMAAARGLVRHALQNLRSGDTFQIIRFSDRASGFAPAPVPATAENVKRGITYVNALHSGGGTRMVEGIKAALDYPADGSRLRMVMFLTDGYIGNENEILAAVRDRIRNTRLFSFGVGSSVNRFLLDRLAEEGRGEVQYFLPGTAVDPAVERFYDRIRNPYLTDVRLEWEGVDVDDAVPSRVPDVFAGRPLRVHGRYDGGGLGTLVVRGRLAGRDWEQRVPLDLPRREAGNPAIGSLWARARIAELEKRQVHGPDPSVTERITQLGLRHRLVTKYTSFVAVEEDLVVGNGYPATVRVPVEMPEGVDFETAVPRAAQAVPQSAWGSVKSLFNSALRATAPEAAPEAPRGSGAAGRGIGGKQERLRALGYLDGGSPPVQGGRAGETRIDVGDVAPTAPAMTAVQLRVSAPDTVAVGERFVLEIEIRNGGRYPVQVPERLLSGEITPAIRVIDGQWKEAVIRDRMTPSGPARTLAPGERVTVRVELDTTDGRLFSGEGHYHLTVLGAAFSAADPQAVRVTLVPRR